MGLVRAFPMSDLYKCMKTTLIMSKLFDRYSVLVILIISKGFSQEINVDGYRFDAKSLSIWIFFIGFQFYFSRV